MRYSPSGRLPVDSRGMSQAEEKLKALDDEAVGSDACERDVAGVLELQIDSSDHLRLFKIM
jgi:hypothetical protein